MYELFIINYLKYFFLLDDHLHDNVPEEGPVPFDPHTLYHGAHEARVGEKRKRENDSNEHRKK